MASSDDVSWKARSKRLTDELGDCGFKETQDVQDFESFNAILEDMFTEYSETPTGRFMDNLKTHFDHIKSFSGAINAATQQNAISASIWSASLAVIECTCRHVKYKEDTLEHLEMFYQSFAMFDEFMGLFPDNRRLRLDLKRLYDTYADFCVLTIRYMRKGTFAQITGNIFSSSSRRNLRAMTKKWDEQTTTFKLHAQLAFEKTLVDRTLTVPSSRPVTQTNTNMPRLQQHITGREAFLNNLHKTLNIDDWQSSSQPSSCLIHAMAGMGKTQTALAYSFRFKQCYDYRWWIRAETPDSLSDSFSSIATILDIKKENENLFLAVKKWMETTGITKKDKSWLAIFDNVEKDIINEVEALLPAQSASKRRSAIIFTSQHEEYEHIVQHSIRLESFSIEDSVQVLMRCLRRDPSKVSDDERTVLKEVSELLGGLPLAIAHVGGYISESKQSLRSFRDFFKTRWPEKVWKESSVLARHDKSLQVIWDLALDDLPTNARKLIHIMAYLNPDVIPESWLKDDIDTNSDWGNEGKSELWDMPRSLSKRCLVDVVHEDGTDRTLFSIHRSLQMTLRLKLDQELGNRSLAFTHALSIVSKASPRASTLQTPDSAQWPAFQKSNPHALALCNAFRESRKTSSPLSPSLELAELLYNAGFHVWETWNPMTQDGILLLETAEEVLDLISTNANDRLRADILCMKSGLLDIVGLSKWKESLKGRQVVCKIRENIFRSQPTASEASAPSENEHLYYNSLNDLALSYLQNDQFLEAEKIFVQCLAKYQEWGTADTIPYEYGKYYHNMAFVRMYQGRFDEALETVTRGVSIKEKTDGTDSSRYWWWQYDVGCIMLQAGQLEEALTQHQEVLKNRRRVCGASQEVTLQSLYTVGAICAHLDKFSEAESYFRDCIERSKKVRWHDGALGRAKWHLAEVLDIQKKEKPLASSLRQEAREALDEIYQQFGELPVYLQNADMMVRYDWSQPSFDGRWTGLGLLPLARNHYQGHRKEVDAISK